jgi:murein DD-endopeptidase MepM/ murein hydrolase activator NlpD
MTRNLGTKEHQGIDINAKRGTPLHAPESGTVTRMSNGPQAGNRIDIQTPGGEVIILVHLDKFTTGMAVGDAVAEGDIVGEAGTTGNQPDPGDSEYDSQQEHVHMAVKDPKGRLIDPEAWLNDPNAPAPLPNP